METEGLEQALERAHTYTGEDKGQIELVTIEGTAG